MAGIVTIGASYGGLQPLRSLAAGLPRDFEAPILIVQHIGSSRSLLPSLLNDVTSLPASHALDGEPIAKRHIYIAPPDHHMMVADGHIRLSHGPRVNWARPAIDPLFRSVAEAFGPMAIGIVLSGSLNDGTAGLYEIKRHGGIAIVQDPQEAEMPSMPRSAIENVAVDFCTPAAEMPALLGRLTQQLEKQRKVPVGVRAMPNTDQQLAIPVAQTCPECGGAMREEQLGTITQFRCHIGHVMTAEVLAAAKLEQLRDDLSICVRAANEQAELCREIARKHETQGKKDSAARWRAAAEEASVRARQLAEFTEKEWISPDLESSSPAQSERHRLMSAGRAPRG